jgi:hypothetical protein
MTLLMTYREDDSELVQAVKEMNAQRDLARIRLQSCLSA